MSMLEKLLIQGIRCYAPGEDQRVVINFRTPLTVIYGANGTGKTTIIECLKYITTGDMPPNSKGGAFVYDPNIAGEREVRAQVKLQFTDLAKNQITCSRSLQATQKVSGGTKKIELKTIDSSMQKIGQDGQKKKITSRCAEIDLEMARHLGVSKAVLNNVLFCHQEDSYWPLSEGKALKTKFDEIFASTRYSKALENVRKFQQEQSQMCKEFKVDLQHLKKHREKATELKGDLSEVQGKIQSSRDSISYIDQQLKPIEDELKELDDKYNEFADKEKELTTLRSKKEHLEESQRSLEDKIGTVTASLDEVKRSLEDHSSRLKKEKKKLQECEDSITQLDTERTEADEKRDQLLKQQGRLRSRAEDNQQNINTRDDLVHNLSSKHGIKVSRKGCDSQLNAEQFLSSLTQQRQLKQQNAHAKQEEYNKQIAGLQEKLNNLILEQAKYNQSKDMKTKLMEENEVKRNDIAEELKDMDATKVEAVEKKLQEAESNLKEFQDHTDIGSLEAEYESLRKQKELIDTTVSALQEELDKLSKHATQRGALDILREKKEEAETRVNELMDDVEGTLEIIFDVMPAVEDLESELSTTKQSSERDLKIVQEKLQQAQETRIRISANQDMLNKRLASAKKEKHSLEQTIAQVCDENDYHSLAKEVQRSVESTQADIAAIQGCIPFLNECLEKVQILKRCPVCSRGLDCQSDVETVITMLTSRVIESTPHELHEQLKKQQEKHKCLQELQLSVDKLEKLDYDDIPSNDEALLSTNKELQSVDGELKKLRAEHLLYRDTLEQIQSVELKVSQLSYHHQDLKKQEQQVAAEEAKLGDGGIAGRDHSEVGREQQNARQVQKEIERKSYQKHKEIADSRNQEIALEKEVQELRKEKLRITESLRRRDGLVEQKADLMSANKMLEKEIVEIDKKTKTMRKKLKSLAAEKEAIEKEMKKDCGRSNAEVDDIYRDESQLKVLIQKINKYHQSGEEQQLEQCEKEMAVNDKTTSEYNQKRSALQREADQMRRKQANSQVKLREYEDTIQYLKQHDEINGIDEKIQEIDTYLREHGMEDYDGKYYTMRIDADRLRKQRAHQEGQQLSLRDEARRLQRDLDGELYKDADTKYLHRAADIKALEVTNSDLDKFYKALDRAITQYHKAKMEEVNKIIRELWIDIYKGGDIDNIEILSDSELHGSSVTTHRRIYHYRVVMYKGRGTKMDMRGRCSAGQKMLASLVIRLALAETFSLNCGILALDEPTTNLDEGNLTALAEALNELIKIRREQSNFQLMIITHDKNFVDLLGSSDHVDDYLELERKGDTTIIGCHPYSH
ncbi:DNA repair protein RAD50.L-like [Dysidea avara]|uniref:DNA repair protein RAD50.L-like n=1 Tax=Dysidea avara TaxID=196820 RepID=UPI00331C1E2D